MQLPLTAQADHKLGEPFSFPTSTDSTVFSVHRDSRCDAFNIIFLTSIPTPALRIVIFVARGNPVLHNRRIIAILVIVQSKKR